MELNMTIMEQCYILALNPVYKMLKEMSHDLDKEYGFSFGSDIDTEMIDSMLPEACIAIGCPSYIAVNVSLNWKKVSTEVQSQYVAWMIFNNKPNMSSYDEFYRSLMKDPNNLKYYEDESLIECYRYYTQFS